jgi:PIN domain nuclease of toxin-antitoxin system
MDCVLDTHPLIFILYHPQSIGKKAIKIIEDDSNKLFIPTMALLEVQYLMEVKKITGSINDFINYIKRMPNMEITGFSESILAETLSLKNTRDPFDRIILSTALSMDIHIITRDKWMKSSYSKTVW